MTPYYHSLFSEISQRSVDATLGVLGIRNSQLRNHLKNQLTDELDRGNRILADPVFEAAFPWEEVEETFNELGARNFLHPSFVEALDAEHTQVRYFNGSQKNLAEQALKRNWRPRTHQLRSWEVLKEEVPKSLIVTSGTGSGKTECFMLPIIDDLVRQHKETGEKLEGVQALFIYPLNALINSQRERILSWTMNFEDKVRFCLYNGTTEKKRNNAAFINGSPKNEVYDRPHLWESPPPILITNPTMLEYMLIRTQDRPILQKSQGKLKYIVLDEAHTYIGSQAAELALLIRRVLNGFGVEAENVRFIATSATIGSDDDSVIALKNYLADIAGISIDSIEVVGGSRTIPFFDALGGNQLTYPELSALDISQNIETLYQNETLTKLRSFFISQDRQQAKARKLTQITNLLFPGQSGEIERQKEALLWIDLASSDQLKKDDIHFLPLRGHFFHKVLSGLWACIDGNCPCKQNTHLSQNWDFGKVYTQQRLTCECGTPVVELVFCSECNESHLRAEIMDENGARRISQVRNISLDEFELNLEQPTEDEEDNEVFSDSNRILIYPRATANSFSGRLNGEGRFGDHPMNYPTQIHFSDQNESCSSCGFNGTRRQESMRRAFLGMPFYISNLIPSLLDHVKDGSSPLIQPSRGRRLLTFTDSRQGTAKIAIKIQQESERIRTRGLILKALLQNDGNQRIQEINEEIEDLESIGPITPVRQRSITNLLNERSQLQNQTKTYTDEITILQTAHDVSEHIRKSFEQLGSPIGNNAADVSATLLIREFSRRPKRANSLETMGLVVISYPKLNNTLICPLEFQHLGLTIADWKDFLKVTLDFFIRDGIYVSIPRDLINWLGGKFSPKYLISPNDPTNPQGRYKRWPSYNPGRGERQHRLVRLLALGLNFDLANPTLAQQDSLNNILEQAWNALVAAQLLSPVDNGFQLQLRDMSFSLQRNAWVCPITRRFLDTTFRGFTPYLPNNTQLVQIHCGEAIQMPSFPRIIANDELDYRRQMKEWVANDELIHQLRMDGLWSEQADRILAGGHFIRSVEHSAQLAQRRLANYEGEFKKGNINVLNCSTTMEMGVDIGGLSIVCNNNVPPHPSNYLQRAGRAGRRGESRALSMTLCKNNPHDQQVFQNPLWAFEAQMKKPKITLSSDRIVRRHLHAFLFSWFLNDILDGLDEVNVTLRSDWFFEQNPSLADQFIVCLEGLLQDYPPSLQHGINYLTRKSVLEGITLQDIILPAKELLEKIQAKWQDQLNYYLEELAAIPNPNNAAFPQYSRRVQADLATHRSTYLLSILISNGFLPGYGFPTNISTFNNFSLTDFIANNNHEVQEREDNVSIATGKPTRNMAIALTEYAPGSQVVLDGKVYTSRGITLNFQNPNDNVITHQVIHRAWRCGACGSSGVSHYRNSNACTNPACPNPTRLEFFDYIEPAGFATSFYDAPTNDISSQEFVPSQAPWVNTNTTLRQLINPSIGSYFSDEDGEIFYHNKGKHGTGFALCFNCGYADSLTPGGLISPDFNEHTKLRGKNSAPGVNAKCHPTVNQTRGNISLGFSDKTDVFELYLKQQQTGEYLVVNEQNRKLAWTLGVAFRHGLAKALGINAEELGVTVKQVVNQNLAASSIYSICLYDTNSGGSGFASIAGQPILFRLMLVHAKELLGCANCQNACQNCLLQYDTKHYVDNLDRRIGLAYLTTDLINSLGLPEGEQVFGDSSLYCQYDFFKELKLSFHGKGDKLQLFLKGDSQDWDIANSSIRTHLAELVGPFGKFEFLELWMESDTFAGLTEDQKMDLYSFLAAYPAISLLHYGTLDLLPNGEILGISWKDQEVIAYASKEAGAVLFNENWGDTLGCMLIKSPFDFGIDQGVPVNRNELITPRSANNISIQIIQELNGPIRDFGLAFWEVISQNMIQNGFSLDAFGELRKVQYSDRHLKTPMTFILLSRVIFSLPFNKSVDFELVISTLQSDKYYRDGFRSLNYSWFREEEESRRDLIEALFTDEENLNYILGQTSRDLSHARELNLEFENGSILKIRLDQGMGYWEPSYKPSYPFYESVPNQIRWIQEKMTGIRTLNSSNTHTYIDIQVD